MKETIEAVLKTLNSMPVQGKNNMEKMLGCILALESLLKELRQDETDNGDE